MSGKNINIHPELVMPGTVYIKPIQANLTYDDNLIGKMDPYITFSIGNHKGKTEVCKDGNKCPYWSRTIALKKTNELYLDVKLKNQKFGLIGKDMGMARIDLKEFTNHMVSYLKWFDLYHENKASGKVLMEITYRPEIQTVSTHPSH